MKSSQSSVLVLHGRESSEVLSFCQALKMLGFVPEICSLAVWEASCIERTNLLTLFWLDGEMTLAEVLSRLLQVKPYSAVAILLAEAVSWKAEGLETFTDVIAWPCPLGELGFRLARAGRLADSQSAPKSCPSTNLIGRSPAFEPILRFIDQVASVQAPVLILGETGTGKEVVARAIHYRSPHCDHPFVPFNCGGIPAELLENELFGHEVGAFTGAQRRHLGLVAQAEGGCLFLDEIDALSLQAQAALLRFLQDHCYRPLGSRQLHQAHVRILAASNADLVARIRVGGFREDLWYRLNVLTLTLPPLRERREDIPLLAEYFLRRFCQSYRRPIRPFSDQTLTRLIQYPWPGNVRELENWVHRTVLLGEERLPGEEDTQTATRSSFQARKSKAIARFEQEYLTELMQFTHGNISQAAKIAGKERRCLGKLLKKHGISSRQFKPS